MSLTLLKVMDKEPGILSFWLSAVVLGGLGFLLGRRRWWLALPVLAVLALGFLGVWHEWMDPTVGPAIAEEAGLSYPWHLIVSKLLATGLTVAGMVWRKRAPNVPPQAESEG